METGTIKTELNREEKRRLKKSLMESTGGGKNSGGSGGGGDDSNSDDFDDSETYSSNKARIFTIFLLLVVLMTFGGLIGAYIVISSSGAMEWRPFQLPVSVWISTAVILFSSISYHLSKKFLFDEKQQQAKTWLLVTTVLGAVFISSQILAWFALVRRGVYVQSNPYAGFFYILTAVHAAHVLGGICALGAIVLRTWYRTNLEAELAYRKNLSNVVGWYWHTMDALWIVLFLLLGFWK